MSQSFWPSFTAPAGQGFHALSAGHALVALHLSGVSGTGQVGGIEQLRGSQSVADLHIAVADAEDLVLAVDIGDLVDKAVLLGLFQNADGLFIGNVVALAGFPAVVGEIAYTDTPGGGVVCAALTHNTPAGPAGALGNTDMALVLLQPVAQVLDIQALVLHGNGLLHGDNVHTDTAAAGRHQMGLSGQRHIGHALEEGGQLRMLLQAGIVGDLAPLVIAGLLAAAALVDVQQLCGAGDIHGHKVAPLGLGGGTAVVVVMVAIVIFQQAQECQLVQHLLEMLLVLLLHVAQLPQLGDGVGLADLHGQHDVAHLVGEQGLQAPVLGILRGDLAQLVLDDVRDHFADLQHLLPGCGIALGGRFQRSFLQFLIDHSLLPFLSGITAYYFCFQFWACSVSQSARACTPSPVLALMGKMRILGLRILAYSVTFSISKSK